MTETLVNIQKLLAEVRQCLLEAQKAFNDQSALLSKTTSELHAALNLAAASSLKRSERDTALTRAEQDEASAAAMREALDLAWGLIANANGGDWTLATPEWRAAAERWRDERYSKAARILEVKP